MGPLIAETLYPGVQFICADILERDPYCLIEDICRAAGVRKQDVLFLWASPPCETFSNAAYNVGRGEGHGYNYRDFNDPERGPCCEDPECKYRAKAILHDRFVPRLQQMIQHDWDHGFHYDYMLENPHGCLGQRPPVADVLRWPDQRVNKFTVDQCAFEKLTQKPTDLWTNLDNFRPKGTTGDGKCHGRCGRGFTTAKGSYKHFQAYAQEPSRQPRGEDRVSIPHMLAVEALGASFDSRSRRCENKVTQKVVIDLCCGYRSISTAVTQMGMRYIGVDILRRD